MRGPVNEPEETRRRCYCLETSRRFCEAEKSNDLSCRSYFHMPRWGFIGSGKMATALVKGMLRAGIATAESISASDPLPAARAGLALRDRGNGLRFEPRGGRAERRPGPGREAAEHARGAARAPAGRDARAPGHLDRGGDHDRLDRRRTGPERPARPGDAQYAGLAGRGGLGLCDGATDPSRG